MVVACVVKTSLCTSVLWCLYVCCAMLTGKQQGNPWFERLLKEIQLTRMRYCLHLESKVQIRPQTPSSSHTLKLLVL